VRGLALIVPLLTLTVWQLAYAVDDRPGQAEAGKLPAGVKHGSGIGTVPTHGEASGLRLEGDTLVYCDKRGERAINLRMARGIARIAACPASGEPNASCSRLGLDVAVRAPLEAPDDIVDVNGLSVPVNGRVRDCSGDGSLIAVATGSSIVLIDVATAKSVTIDHTGGERIIVGPNWVAWSTGARLRWVSRR
jgi:hypothetical protein